MGSVVSKFIMIDKENIKFEVSFKIEGDFTGDNLKKLNFKMKNFMLLIEGYRYMDGILTVYGNSPIGLEDTWDNLNNMLSFVISIIAE